MSNFRSFILKIEDMRMDPPDEFVLETCSRRDDHLVRTRYVRADGSFGKYADLIKDYMRRRLDADQMVGALMKDGKISNVYEARAILDLIISDDNPYWNPAGSPTS